MSAFHYFIIDIYSLIKSYYPFRYATVLLLILKYPIFCVINQLTLSLSHSLSLSRALCPSFSALFFFECCWFIRANVEIVSLTSYLFSECEIVHLSSKWEMEEEEWRERERDRERERERLSETGWKGVNGRVCFTHLYSAKHNIKR